MARLRSPKGRRAHLTSSLFAYVAAAGAGGALRSKSVPSRTASMPVRIIAATAVTAGALAAIGHDTHTEAPPAAAEGANVLRMGVEELVHAAPVQTAARATEQAEVAEALKQIPAAAVVPAAASAVQIVDGQVSSGFGPRGGTVHEGLDIAAPIGTPIRAPLAGTVISSGPANGFGLWVRVQHGDGTITVYGHINRSLVAVGQQVAAGTVIAEVGNRGQSTGPHLHIEVITSGGQKIDPLPWLGQRGIRFT